MGFNSAFKGLNFNPILVFEMNGTTTALLECISHATTVLADMTRLEFSFSFSLSLSLSLSQRSSF